MDIERKLWELKRHDGECPDYIRGECDECGACELYGKEVIK